MKSSPLLSCCLLSTTALCAAAEPIMRLTPATEVVVQPHTWNCRVDLAQPMPGHRIAIEGLPEATIERTDARTALVTWSRPDGELSHRRVRLVLRDQHGAVAEARDLLLVVRLPARAKG